MNITLLVDGVRVELPCLENEIKVIVELDSEEGPFEEHFTFTHEGVITDLVHDGEVGATSSRCYGEEP